MLASAKGHWDLQPPSLPPAPTLSFSESLPGEGTTALLGCSGSQVIRVGVLPSERTSHSCLSPDPVVMESCQEKFFIRAQGIAHSAIKSNSNNESSNNL